MKDNRLPGLSLLDYLWTNYGLYSVLSSSEELDTIPTTEVVNELINKVQDKSVSEFGRRTITLDDVESGISIEEGTSVFYIKFSDNTELVTPCIVNCIESYSSKLLLHIEACTYKLYLELVKKNGSTIYFIYDTNSIYLGYTLLGKLYRLATDSSEGLISSSEKNLISSIAYLGTFSNIDAASKEATNVKYKKASILLFDAIESSIGQTPIRGMILQQVIEGRWLGTMQYLFWRREIKRRNIMNYNTPYQNVYPWEIADTQKLMYNSSSKTLQLTNYENSVMSSVPLPSYTKEEVDAKILELTNRILALELRS